MASTSALTQRLSDSEDTAVPRRHRTSADSELSSISSQTPDTEDDLIGEQCLLSTDWTVISRLNGDMAPTKILVYEALLLFLRGACNTEISGWRVLQTILDGYLISMAFDSVVTAIAESLKCLKTLLELSSEHGLSNDPKLRTALRIDDERIASLLVSIFNSESAVEAVLRLEDDSAQCFLDVVQDEHSRMAHRMIRKLSESCDRLPSHLFITGVSERAEYPTFAGGYGDIFRASYDSKPVALKRMRYCLHGSELRRFRSELCREALVWKDLHHPHILPFLGIDRDSFSSSDTLCMVSPWMRYGTVMNYLEVYGHANVNKLLYEAAQGLQYLHSCNIVHGDLKGANILVNDDWSACLADFGLSHFSDATSRTSNRGGGTLYWMAPELHGNIGLAPTRRTPASDVYAFGCVCIELYTGRPPFGNLSGFAALMQIVNGERPERPPGPPAMSDILWQHVTEFWAQDPSARPQTRRVVESMVWPAPDSDLSTAASP